MIADVFQPSPVVVVIVGWFVVSVLFGLAIAVVAWDGRVQRARRDLADGDHHPGETTFPTEWDRKEHA